MLDRLRAWLRAISTRQTNTPLADTATDVTTQDNTRLAHESEDPQPCPQTVVPYDEHLLERTRTQWPCWPCSPRRATPKMATAQRHGNSFAWPKSGAAPPGWFGKY